MSYANTGLRCLVSRIGGGPALWQYTSADAHGTVAGAGYFTDGANFGLKVNDTMIVVDTNVPTCTIHRVLNATTINTATLA